MLSKSIIINHKLPLLLAAKSTTTSFIRLASTSTATSSPIRKEDQPKQEVVADNGTHYVKLSKEKELPVERLFDISTKVYSPTDEALQDDTKFITHPLYPHPVWTLKECEKVGITHREPRTIGDKISYYGTQYCRGLFDIFTGYKEANGDSYKYKGTRYFMNDSKFITRCLFLESIAAVPPSTAGFLRTLHSIRLLRRDKAWIDTLADEAYNERMHLLTFIKVGKPSWFTRTMIYLGQGVFTNIFFFTYLLNPRYCHRFVGYLEEEAVKTYTHLIDDLSIPGRLPLLEKTKVPKIAQQYWHGLNENSSFKDLILKIRADEAKHREINHTFANLNTTDRNPFALEIKDFHEPQPNDGLEVTRPTGWERKDLYL
ncbi:unnamed protein product [Candida verbasci]|uniref:Alternative oxidase n=1 Tax=Candida verbasci TaxID=1227364 RepID=A0A9W4TVL5_9ASCO|nr:unnamed protein product [Candida verbasci]